MRKWLLLLSLSCLWAFPEQVYPQFIQQRFLPANGQRGTLGAPLSYPEVQISKKVLRLAPGARIYDQSNRTIVHAHLPPGAEVLFATETSGAVLRIYILTEQEIQRLKKAGKS